MKEATMQYDGVAGIGDEVREGDVRLEGLRGGRE
jgi:hypothetical protein